MIRSLVTTFTDLDKVTRGLKLRPLDHKTPTLAVSFSGSFSLSLGMSKPQLNITHRVTPQKQTSAILPSYSFLEKISRAM